MALGGNNWADRKGYLDYCSDWVVKEKHSAWRRAMYGKESVTQRKQSYEGHSQDEGPRCEWAAVFADHGQSSMSTCSNMEKGAWLECDLP